MMNYSFGSFVVIEGSSVVKATDNVLVAPGKVEQEGSSPFCHQDSGLISHFQFLSLLVLLLHLEGQLSPF